MVFNISNLLVIQITDFCNYECSYCEFKYSLNRSLKQKSRSKHKIFNIKDFLQLNNSPFKNFLITGGEPSIAPNFLKIISYISSDHNIIVFSNLSASINIYKKAIELDNKILFVLTYHGFDYENFLYKSLQLKHNIYAVIFIYNKYNRHEILKKFNSYPMLKKFLISVDDSYQKIIYKNVSKYFFYGNNIDSYQHICI